MTGITNAQDKGFKYSTTEQFTGKYWLDGRKIYNIWCYPSNTGSLTNNQQVVVPFTDFNATVKPEIDLLLNVEFGGYKNSSNYPDACFVSAIRNAQLVANGVNMVNIGTTSDYLPTTVFYFEYIKTT